MSTQLERGIGTFIAGLAIARFRRVLLTSGKLAVAGDTDLETGTLENEAFQDGDVVAVRLRNAPGTVLMVADGVIAVEAEVFTAAAGKISATQGSGSRVGIAHQAASADLDEIEILRD